MQLKFIGVRYNGIDPETNATIQVVGGQYVTVSDSKAEQLLKDYPKFWIKANAKKEIEEPSLASESTTLDSTPEEDPVEQKAKAKKKKVPKKRKK